MRKGADRAGASEITVDIMDKLVRWSVVGLKFGAGALAIGTAYLLWATYGGYLRQDVDARTLGNLQLMGQLMALGGAVSVVCLVIVSYEEMAYAVIALLLGVAYLFGFPLIVAGQLEGAVRRASDIILQWTNTTGHVIIVVAGVRILLEVVRYIRLAPTRRDAIAPAAKPTSKALGRPWYRLSRCWELPHCHEAIRDLCPAHEKGRSCWRLRLGCNCDPNLIEALIRSGGATRGKSDATSGRRAVQEAYVRSDLTQDKRVGASERTRECRNCPIFNEHQREKFKVLNPILLVGTIVALLAAYPVMKTLYTAAINGMANIASKLALGDYLSPSRWIQRLDSPAVWIFFYIIVGLFALYYVMKFIEWAILVRKL